MNEELDGADGYLECASMAKADGDTSLYEMAMKIAHDELGHASDWHTALMVLIDKERLSSNMQQDESSMLVKEYLDDIHKDYLKRVAELKYMLEIVKS